MRESGLSHLVERHRCDQCVPGIHAVNEKPRRLACRLTAARRRAFGAGDQQPAGVLRRRAQIPHHRTHSDCQHAEIEQVLEQQPDRARQILSAHALLRCRLLARLTRWCNRCPGLRTICALCRK
eukprot:scaffold61486_cov28-Tisochrysis_lutea.AAC.2